MKMEEVRKTHLFLPLSPLFIYIMSLVAQSIHHFITLTRGLIKKIIKGRKNKVMAMVQVAARIWIRKCMPCCGGKLESTQQLKGKGK